MIEGKLNVNLEGVNDTWKITEIEDVVESWGPFTDVISAVTRRGKISTTWGGIKANGR